MGSAVLMRWWAGMAACLLLVFSGPAFADDLLIIANPSVSLDTPLSLRELTAIYLLRVTRWPDGTHIVPVNREFGSALRARFTTSVLHEQNERLARYWNQMHFQGKDPPLVQESEDSMLAFVRSVPGAIGYIRASREPDGVKVLRRVPGN